MEAGTVTICSLPKRCCLLVCILKATLVVLVAVFVLYLPMGDPRIYCAKSSESQNKPETMCCLCDIYLIGIRAANKTSEVVELMFCVVSNLLYEAKLKFYSILEKIDRDDLCRSICCYDSSDSIDTKKENNYPTCRCKKTCTKKKLDKA